MNRIYFELYSRSKKVTIYSIRFEGSPRCETDVFIKEFTRIGFAVDVEMIRSWLWYIKERGAQMRYFRPENNVSAGPITFSKLRIYCIRCSENIVILDGGGEKKGQKTQDGAETWRAMRLMMDIDRKLIEKIRAGDIHYSSDLMQLEGELFIDI
ncbi:hypothetical protein GCM10010967_31350 [Dyadobacter beijingensis]|uniref:Uncharacterized protein n=1 Tax=Dyadobacter beijingensis TaxID=365489 RepID=A0ABQ2HZV0_9BACT|nr:hypothetical protein [Dyadobacter beijingensis]GGM95630.1 hypothetical protein GCM10010967_31350 [Dyadobacter beijingensis]